MRFALWGTVIAVVSGCNGPPQAPSYYEQVIQPIFTASCVRNQANCHKDDGTGNALGNLDLTSFAAVNKRRDVLTIYGSYPISLLQLKGVGRQAPAIPYQGGGTMQTIPSEVDHAGGATISLDSNAFFELQRWISNGANEDGRVSERQGTEGTGDCRADYRTLRADSAAAVATVNDNTPGFRYFVDNIEPILTKTCAFATCHSSEQSDFHLACAGGDNSKFNFLEAQAFVADPAQRSLVLLKPLAPSAGGIAHTGGAFFDAQSNPDWQKMLMWATQAGVSSAALNLTEGERFFDRQVMPTLLKRGCALQACHSPGAANDLKLRAGTQGVFSPFALHSSYKSAREFLRADVPDVRESRIVKKPVISVAEGGIGLIHRGGPPLQSPGDPANPSVDCPQGPAYDAAAASPNSPTHPTPVCTIAEWHRRERLDLGAGNVSTLATGDTVSLVVVQRPANEDRAIDFDTYRPGADLILANATLRAPGSINPATVALAGSLLDNCPGSVINRDVRGPDVNYGAAKVAFAMRIDPGQPLTLYEVTLDGTKTCTAVDTKRGASTNGILIHDFDPMYTPTDALVFASTRGRTAPTRSPKFLLPQSDLWRMEAAGAGYGPVQQMTALNGSELAPEMMANGQISFTAEKATADFYQLSGRRINWDLTDYHPLLAQRAQSRGLAATMQPSVDYAQATEIREGIDRNFVFILSDVGTKSGGGALGIFNRSIGPFQSNRNDITFLRALTIVDGAASGRTSGAVGAYRSPFPLPDGRILVSYASDANVGRFALVVIDTLGNREAIPALTGTSSFVEGLMVFKRERHAMFKNVHQLVFGGLVDSTDAAHGVVHYPDLPLLGTLLGANLRSGRFVSDLRAASELVVYEDLPTPADLGQAMAGRTGTQMVYQNRRELGKAGLAQDGSVQIRLPSLLPTILELRDSSGRAVFTMTEEDQVGPGERISRGVPQQFFDSVCGGCHGSVTGIELDVSPNIDALTGASVSLSRDTRTNIGP